MAARMIKLIIGLLLCRFDNLISVNGQSDQSDSSDYDEKYRLQFHYSVPSGWGNDPNGLIYANGFYHLYYQYTTDDKMEGQVHWGHATSSDLIHWEPQQIAIYPDGEGAIFSGSAILDPSNVTGFSEDSSPAIIALYTIDGGEQSQGLAYSEDGGQTFSHYEGNPIIPNPGLTDFRDPNVFIINGTYYMVVTGGTYLKFYRSDDLENWEYISDFGENPDQGDKSAGWECPSFATLRDENGNKHDIIMISVNNREMRYGQTEYFIGKFDGTTFNTDDPSRDLRADYGFDNYASIPYNNDPEGREIIIGWLSHWKYAADIPTSGWRGQYTLPRVMSLQTVDGLLYLTQKLIDTFDSLVDGSRTWSSSSQDELSGQKLLDIGAQLSFDTGSMLLLEYTLNISNATSGKIGFQFGNDQGEYISFDYSIDEGVYELDRSKSGDVSFNSQFADEIAQAERITSSHLLTGLIVLDTASIEILADDGLTVFSGIFFPSELYKNIQIIASLGDGDSVVVEECSVSAIKSIWSE